MKNFQREIFRWVQENAAGVNIGLVVMSAAAAFAMMVVMIVVMSASTVMVVVVVMMVMSASAAFAVFMVVMMVVTVRFVVCIQLACQQCSNCSVCITGNACIYFNICIVQCDSCTHTHAAADQCTNTMLCQVACQCAVAEAVGSDDLAGNHCTVFYFINLKVFSPSEMLKNLTVFVSYCNFHKCNPPDYDLI